VRPSAAPVIPGELYGFSVTVAIGPYPIDAPLSHRKAMYAELRPNTDHTRAVFRRLNRDRILGQVPLTMRAGLEIQADPDGRLAEKVGLAALREASKLAKQVDDSR
jgi:hypothetical protein